MNDLLREAIADAKAVKEVALANAKLALEEAFTPRLQSMLSKKLSEEAEAEETEEPVEEYGFYNEADEEEEPAMEEGEEGEEEEVDIKEVLRALREEEDEAEAEPEEAPVEESRLREAYAVIRFLRSKINEVNLLNSKLLFSNKLFRSNSLSEAQKMTVIENFDRATSLREVKLVYATLAESLKGATKVRQIKESFASKPIASTRPSKNILNEGDVMANRLRKLAGLK